MKESSTEKTRASTDNVFGYVLFVLVSHLPIFNSKLLLLRSFADSCGETARSSTALCLTKVDTWMSYVNEAEVTEANKRLNLKIYQ